MTTDQWIAVSAGVGVPVVLSVVGYVRHLLTKVNKAKAAAAAADARINTHEKVCAERYKRVDDKLDTLKKDSDETRALLQQVLLRLP